VTEKTHQKVDRFPVTNSDIIQGVLVGMAEESEWFRRAVHWGVLVKAEGK